MITHILNLSTSYFKFGKFVFSINLPFRLVVGDILNLTMMENKGILLQGDINEWRLAIEVSPFSKVNENRIEIDKNGNILIEMSI